jgi:hypothetical protein
MVAQALIGPGLENLGATHEQASTSIDLAQALTGNPTKLLPKLYSGGKAGAKIYDFLQANRSALDQSGSGGGGGTTEGTITIDHQRPLAQPEVRKRPLFRQSTINRQSQMEPAAGGPPNNWAQSESVPGP